MNRKRLLAIFLVLIVIAGSLFLYSRGNKKVQTATPEGIRTVPVVRGPIESRISASGSLAAERTQPLTFSTSGTVAEVLVKEGDVVAQGQVLARLDTKDLELSVKQAQAALQVSESSLARTRKSPSKEEIAAAQAAVEAAKASLKDLQTGPTTAEVASAKAAVEAAKANLKDFKAGPSARDIRLADLAIAQAKNSRWGIQASRDSVRAVPGTSQGAKDQAESQVLNAEIQVEIAQINREKLNDPSKASAIKSAESQLVQAESTLARLLSTPSQEDIAQAEAQVAQARVGVEIAQGRLDDSMLAAPFAGKLADWSLYVGDNVTPATPAGTLADVSRYHIDVSIDETEISQVAVGQKVLITLDAFPDHELEGRVSKVSLLGSSSQGIVNYNVRIDLSPTELPIKPLMTAAINIIVERKDSVLLVPNRALKRDNQGKYVEVLRNQTPKRVYVKTGVANEDNTEIVEGLEEGQQVVVGTPRVNILGGPSFGGGGG